MSLLSLSQLGKYLKMSSEGMRRKIIHGEWQDMPHMRLPKTKKLPGRLRFDVKKVVKYLEDKFGYW